MFQRMTPAACSTIGFSDSTTVERAWAGDVRTCDGTHISTGGGCSRSDGPVGWWNL